MLLFLPYTLSYAVRARMQSISVLYFFVPMHTQLVLGKKFCAHYRQNIELAMVAGKRMSYLPCAKHLTKTLATYNGCVVYLGHHIPHDKNICEPCTE